MATLNTVQTLAVTIIRAAPSRLFTGRASAPTMPSMIGITAPTRAVAEGTNSAKTKPTVTAPSISPATEVPTRFMTTSAMRRSRPVARIAAARNSAPATSATAPEPKPLSIRPSASVLASGLAAPGSVLPTSARQAAPARMTALVAGGTHSVIQRITASTSSASAAWPARLLTRRAHQSAVSTPRTALFP